MMNRKRLLSMLDSYSNPTLIKEYLRSLIELEITPFEDENSLKKVDLDYVTREILKYNLTIKSIDAVTHDYNPNKYKLIIEKGFNFNINYKEKYKSKIFNLININYGKDIILTINDRKNINSLLESKLLEKKKLEDYYYYNFYIYFGSLNSKEELEEIDKITSKIKLLDYEINELEVLSDFKEIEYLNDLLIDRLHIHEILNETINDEGIYETNKISDYNQIKVYKKQIRR